MIQRRDLLRVPQGKTSQGQTHRGRLWGSLATVGLLAGLIGCGGGGDDGNNGTSTSGTATATTTGGDIATINLPNTPGTLDFTFLTGAGRAAGDRTAVVRRINASDANGTVETRLSGERRLVLNRYSSQILDLSVPTLNLTSREFTNIQFDVLRYEEESLNDDGTTSTATYSSVANIPVDLPASVRVFPGRTVHIPFYLDTDTISVDPSTGRASFSLTNFQSINFRPEQEKTIQGTLADYMAFNVSGMSAGNRPTLSNGNVATRVFFSGDGYALADLDPFTGSSVNFEPLLPGGQQDVALGRLAAPSSIPSQGGTAGETPGTYSMVQANPTDTSNLTRITSLQGTWRDHYRQRINSSNAVSNVGYLSNAPEFTMVTIPSSEDNGRQDLIAVAQTFTTNSNGTRTAVISNCYFGYVDYDTNRFFMYPIKNITSVIGGSGSGGSAQGEVNGTISATLNSGGTATSTVGSIRSGSFTISSGGTPTGFPSSGRFVVFRR